MPTQQALLHTTKADKRMNFGGKSGLQIDTQYQVGQAVTALNVTPDHTYSIGVHSQQTS